MVHVFLIFFGKVTLAVLRCQTSELHSIVLGTPILRTAAQQLPISLVGGGRLFAVVFIPQGFARREPKVKYKTRWELGSLVFVCYHWCLGAHGSLIN